MLPNAVLVTSLTDDTTDNLRVQSLIPKDKKKTKTYDHEVTLMLTSVTF